MCQTAPAVRATEGVLPISIRTAVGRGRTALSSFDDALARAGVANFNLIRLSSVIPAQSSITSGVGRLPGEYGDRLYCVYSTAYADEPASTAWAGLGWVRDDVGRGLFVEHSGDTEETVLELINLTLGDMAARRGGGYGPVQAATVAAHHDGRPACALAIATYEVAGWML